MKDPLCDVEVGTHDEPYYADKNSSLIVCARHKGQYDERKEEFGPYDWELLEAVVELE